MASSTNPNNGLGNTSQIVRGVVNKMLHDGSHASSMAAVRDEAFKNYRPEQDATGLPGQSSKNSRGKSKKSGKQGSQEFGNIVMIPFGLLKISGGKIKPPTMNQMQVLESYGMAVTYGTTARHQQIDISWGPKAINQMLRGLFPHCFGIMARSHPWIQTIDANDAVRETREFPYVLLCNEKNLLKVVPAGYITGAQILANKGRKGVGKTELTIWIGTRQEIPEPVYTSPRIREVNSTLSEGSMIDPGPEATPIALASAPIPSTSASGSSLGKRKELHPVGLGSTSSTGQETAHDYKGKGKAIEDPLFTPLEDSGSEELPFSVLDGYDSEDYKPKRRRSSTAPLSTFPQPSSSHNLPHLPEVGPPPTAAPETVDGASSAGNNGAENGIIDLTADQDPWFENNDGTITGGPSTPSPKASPTPDLQSPLVYPTQEYDNVFDPDRKVFIHFH
ncbi:hypothetical protein ONZ45_g3291 [Pleurotus djamor]|nr:hypothetical protein ONZ45_g3291 [Pleurotus djamor]